jgi:hypothetical protein
VAEDRDFHLFHLGTARPSDAVVHWLASQQEIRFSVGIVISSLLVTVAATVGGQSLEQCVDAGPGGREARLEAITLASERGHLVEQQLVGASEFFVPQQEAVDACGEILQRGHGKLQAASAADDTALAGAPDAA